MPVALKLQFIDRAFATFQTDQGSPNWDFASSDQNDRAAFRAFMRLLE